MLNIGVRELERKIEEKKQEISEFKNKFTSQDELVELIELQKQTNELLILTNRILFTQLKIQSGGETPVLEGIEGLTGDYQTLNKILSGKDVNISEKGSGIIDTIKLVSLTTSVDNKDYSVEIVCDDNILYKDTWDNLEARTATERGMVCYEDDIKEQYLLIFRTILYTESFEVKVFDSNATFSLFQVKYHRKV